MIEASASAHMKEAFAAARHERAQAFRALLSVIVQPFRSLNWPQGDARRWSVPPQGCPAGR